MQTCRKLKSFEGRKHGTVKTTDHTRLRHSFSLFVLDLDVWDLIGSVRFSWTLEKDERDEERTLKKVRENNSSRENVGRQGKTKRNRSDSSSRPSSSLGDKARDISKVI